MLEVVDTCFHMRVPPTTRQLNNVQKMHFHMTLPPH